MLRRLERIFVQYIPQSSRVLDAGCGRSLFTEIRPRWPFMLVAADLEHALLCERGRSSATSSGWWPTRRPLPFRSDSFHALFAGELIEHLVDPRQGVAEFRRVLQPRGVLILTTPNRRRLANVVDGSERPYSPDHLSELTYDEVRALLADGGSRCWRPPACTWSCCSTGSRASPSWTGSSGAGTGRGRCP